MIHSDISVEIILDSICDGVFTVGKEGVITSFNKAAEDITGFSRDEAVGQFCFEIFRANICQTRCALKETLETRKEIKNFPVNILNKNGKVVPISISTAILRDSHGNIIGGVETFRDLSSIEELKKEIKKQYTFHDIVTRNRKLQQIIEILPDIAESDSTVLIQGPSGAGKELFARAIHDISPREKGPYVKVNCGALPETLLESELFGYKKGAFTDARFDKPGRFKLAEGGTIFLDEIGDLPKHLQVKLLGVLQKREYEPLGGVKTEKADVRVIAATNKELLKLVNEGVFREDLYFRLNVIKIDLPPLSERREDIPLLIEEFINRFNQKKGKEIIGVSDDVLGLLMKYEFSGNVRELENIIEHGFVLCKGNYIEIEHLPKEILITYPPERTEAMLLKRPIESAEAELIKRVLEKHQGNKIKTAQELGINRSTLWRKLKKYKS
ncbi:MAG: sigma 54-interacting transcriptional regulator [Thermodesulfobacteriota bacterium]|nr:sigma 54-interacting transcriptional regulator [Thermodesulfobacteriota bacterium]